MNTYQNHCDTRSWKSLTIPFGEDSFTVQAPPHCETLNMPAPPQQPLTRTDIIHALQHPFGCDSLPTIIDKHPKPNPELTVCITVSDITRPVPYRGPEGVLSVLLHMIEATGVQREHIVILIGNGMHRTSTLSERITMYGQEIVDQYRIVDHNCEDNENLTLVSKTSTGTNVHINKRFYEADIKIVTGLVESHFMAGASGGRKGVCPALVNTKTLEKFHGVDFLEHPKATNLSLNGNPCHEEASEVAKSVGIDFLVNTTLDHQLKLTGVYAGHFEDAHLAAVQAMQASVSIPITPPYDVIITHGGYVGRNHYQCAKAAVGAIPAVQQNGFIIISANNFDEEPIGGPEYCTLLHLLKILGPDRYVSMLRHQDWVFTKDQWQPQMWAKPLRHVGSEGLLFCAPQLSPKDCAIIPGITGQSLCDTMPHETPMKEQAKNMLQNAICHAVSHPKWENHQPTIAFIADGPYAVPIRDVHL